MMHTYNVGEGSPLPSKLIAIGFMLILAGMVLMIIAAITSVTPGEGLHGFFFFFPFPFLFGYGFGGGEGIILPFAVFTAIALVFIAFVAYVFFKTLRLQP